MQILAKRKNSIKLFLALAALSYGTFFTATWDGSINSNVVDEHITVSGRNTLSSPVMVSAENSDVTIDVSATSVISGNGRLHLSAAAGRTITFKCDGSLIFQGASGLLTSAGLLISASGAGAIAFEVAGGKSLTFENGAKFFVVMNQGTPGPQVSISRLGGDSAPEEDVSIILGAKSMISYLARDGVSNGIASSSGTLRFVPTNLGTGRMVMHINNNASCVIAGHTLTNDNADFSLEDIDFHTPAGQNAVFEVMGAGGLQIINENNVFSPSHIDPHGNGAFFKSDGIRRGFVLSANGSLVLNDRTYLDYVGTTKNVCPDTSLKSSVKYRNPSAFVIDGDAHFNAIPASIVMGGSSAIYLRSGVDKNGNVSDSFVIDPMRKTDGIGNVVLAVEGKATVHGDNPMTNAIEILSLEVAPSGGSVTIDSSESTFPKRTFARTTGSYNSYNAGHFLINNTFDLHGVSLVHSDYNHGVVEKNDTISEATYVGGETHTMLPGASRPRIGLVNSMFRFHTDAAFTGVDICVPNRRSGNVSALKFYHNGFKREDATGRQLVLGTNVGAVACDGKSLVNRDAHLDVFQKTEQPNASIHQLDIRTGANNGDMVFGISGDISSQLSLHTIYQGHGSNISIGTNGSMGVDDRGVAFPLTTNPTMIINGNYFAFETRGGDCGVAETSAITGCGGIFVDSHGKLGIEASRRAHMATMVVKSRSGEIDLPKQQVTFEAGIGVAGWKVDLSDPITRVLVGEGECLSDYTLDWLGARKDYSNFTPYEVAIEACGCPEVSARNIASLPVVKGTVDQFQIKGSRLGNQAHLMVDGGKVRELIFQSGEKAGEERIGFVALQNDGIVGLGSAGGTDSQDATAVLGMNGITLIPNGSGQVELNDSLVISSLCPIMPGPDFGANGPSRLILDATGALEIRVKSRGVLDLSHFTSPNHILEISGRVQLVFEPGATLVLGGGVLKLSDESRMYFEPNIDQNGTVGSSPASSNGTRSRILGKGVIQLDESASMVIPRGALVGIETDGCYAQETDIVLMLNNSASVHIGDENSYGGGLQIGNVTNMTGAKIGFGLVMNGTGAMFEVNRQGFLGFGAGVTHKPNGVPNTWRLGSLHNVTAVSFNLNEGTFSHNQIYCSKCDRSAICAIGDAGSYSFTMNRNNVHMRGGSNLVKLAAGSSSVAPQVENTPGDVSAALTVGLMSSGSMLTDASKASMPFTGSASAMFDFFKMNDYPLNGAEGQSNPQAAIMQNSIGASKIGYVIPGEIKRSIQTTITGRGGASVTHDAAVRYGAVSLMLGSDGTVAYVGQIKP